MRGDPPQLWLRSCGSFCNFPAFFAVRPSVIILGLLIRPAASWSASGAENCMNFSIIDDDGDVIHVRCDGDLANTDSQESDQLKNLLGPERMTRKVLMNLEKVRFLD